MRFWASSIIFLLKSIPNIFVAPCSSANLQCQPYPHPKSNGWALNTEYFAEVLHLLRDDLTYTTIVDECLAVPAKPDKRDLTAIKRLCTAFVKLLYPNATCKDDIPADEFIKYCLEPAKEMRGVIKKQLCIIDPKEFNVPGKKDIPDIQYNYM